jgi:hypothetical protein
MVSMLTPAYLDRAPMVKLQARDVVTFFGIKKSLNL